MRLSLRPRLLLFSSWNPIAAVLGPSPPIFVIILIDNVTARVKWELALTSAWIVAIVAGVGNLIPFYLIARGLH